MCQALEELAAKAAQEAIRRERERVALELLTLGIFPYEEIADISQLTLEEISELNAQRNA